MMKKLMLRKTNIWFMVVIFFFTVLLSTFSLNTMAETGSPPASQYSPNIVVSLKEDVELVAGKTNKLVFTLKNISTNASARNIMFSPIYEGESTFISVKPVTEMPIKYLGSYNGTTELELEIEVDKFTNTGMHPLTFNLSYSNVTDESPVTTNHTVYVRVVNYQTNCKLTLESVEDISATAGSSFDLPLVVKNIGNLSAKDVRINILGLSQDTFTLVSGLGTYNYDKFNGNEAKDIIFSLRASSSLKSGSYPVKFSLEYTDEKGEKMPTEEQEIWIPIGGGAGAGTVLEVTDIRSTKTTVKPEESFDVVLNVKNSGNFDTGQIKVSADGTGELLPISQNLHIIQTLKKGESKSIKFSFQPKPNATRGSVPITISVEPVDGSEGVAISQAISVFVESEPTDEQEAGKNIPKIIIKSYSSDPTLVNAGENFDLRMQFLNTHSAREVRNIKGSITVTESSSETGNVFTPVGSSNTFYIDKISPQKTADWNVTLYTIPDAKSKTYTVSIAFEYEDDLGTQHTATELIGIPVYQPSKFEVSEIMVPPDANLGMPVYVGFEMYNLGKTDIYNVKLNVEGDFDAQPKSNYFGNFESGRVEYFEFNLIPMMVGEANGRIIFQYEDASGEVQEVVKEISMNVMEMMMPPEGEFPVDGFPMEPGMEESKGFIGSLWFYIIIGVVVVVGVVVTVTLVKRKKKKDKEFEF